MNPIAIVAIVVAAAVLLFVVLGWTALRGKKREGELNAEVEQLEVDDKLRKRIEDIRATPMPSNARAAWEHFIRVRYGEKLRTSASMQRTKSGNSGRDGDSRPES